MSKSAKQQSGKAPVATRIAERLAGRHVLVTGATGLLGKVFVEKLLRSVPQIGKITLLVRGRADGLSSEERVASEILTSSVFERLGALLGPRFPEMCREKIGVVSGDLTHDRLGLSDEDYAALVGDVDVIVNSAAAVTFDERLDIALSLNALGPTRLLGLAKDAGDIPFMQVSTCYVSGRRNGEIREEVTGGDGQEPAGSGIDIDEAIRRMEDTCRRIKDEPALDGEALRRKLIDAGMELARGYDWNDTYTFTKWLGEQLVVRARGKVPLVLLRPAIIEGSYEEPVPGWIDGLRMADPMIMAFGRGKLGEFPGDPQIPIDLIPVDHVANAMIAALPLPAGSCPSPEDGSGVRVYQVASSHTNPLMIAELARCLGESFRRRPMLDDADRPIDAGEFRLVDRESFERKWRRKAARLEKIRAGLGFFGLAPERRRRIGTILTQIEQVLYFASIYLPYTHLDCRFADHNLRALAESMHPDDRAEFPFDVEKIDWPDYLINRHIPGLRKFVLGGGKSVQPEVVRVDDREIRSARAQSRTIFEVFERVAHICGNKIMLQMCREGRWVRYTYAEALAATVAVARRLQELKLRPGDRVALCAESCPEWGVLYLAAQRSGLTVVPLDPQLPPDEILAGARFAKAKFIFADQSTCEAISDASASTGGAVVVEIGAQLVPPPGGSRDEGPSPAAQDVERIASILFTSGTTVAPKAVPLTHTNLMADALGLLDVHPLMSNDSFISVLPMYHAFEFTGGFLLPICIGATVTYVETLKAPEVLATMQAVHPTHMLAVPRLLKLFNDAIQRQVRESGLLTRATFRTLGILAKLSGGVLNRRLFGRVHTQFGGQLRMFISGGSALDPELFAGFTRMGFEVCEGYGLTETSPVLTVSPPGRGKAGSTGPPLPGIDLEIRNANNAGIGELWVRGPVVMSGYLDNAEATAEVMRDGWFRTGDLVRRDGDGYCYITGRVKDMIVTEAGKNVYPDEVEVRYSHLPYVKEMCVVGVPLAGGIGESVHAVVVPDYAGHPELDTSAIERTIREEASAIGDAIPTHQRIQSLHFWSVELPKTSTLKAKRGVIRDMLCDGGPDPSAPAQPAPAKGSKRRAPKSEGLTKGQSYVLKILAELTREPESSIHADSNLLLDLGVDSLMKLQLIGELEAHFDVTCTNETAAALARVSDVFALIGKKSPRRGPARAGKSWSERQQEMSAAPEADIADVGTGRIPTGLLPARWAARGGLRLFFRSYIRVRARGAENIPCEGPFLVTPNHSSHIDAAAVLTALAGRRRVWTAGAEDYFFNTPLKRWVFGHLLDTIPFDRHSEGFEGLRRCLEKLEQGDGVLFFPEGTRSLTGRMGEFKMGGALMAIEAGVPVIPTRIDHAFDLLPKGRRVARPGVVKITFGAPIDPGKWKCTDDLNRQAQLCREFSRYMREQVIRLGEGPMIEGEES